MKSTRKMFKALLGGVILLLGFALTGQALAQGGTWQIKESMPTARAGVATGIVNGKLYVVTGGIEGGYESNVNEAYNPASDSWIVTTPILTPRAYAGAAGIGDKLYVVGGCSVNGNCGSHTTNILEVYDEASNSWATKVSMPTPRSQMAIGAIGGKLYVVGGTNGATTTYDKLEVYDPATDSWTAGAPMLTARSHVDGAVIEGKLYVVGGAAGSTHFDTLEVYDPDTNTWATKAPMPAVRYAVGTAAVNGILYAVGGANAVATLNTVEAYNPATDIWTAVASIPTARYLPRPQVIDGVLYVAGNGPANTAISTLEAFTPADTTLPVAIDIKPGSFPNSINLGSAGVVPVAILSSATFDATQVDPATVTLAGATVRLIGKASKYSCSAQDVNSDGLTDLVCHVETAQFTIEPGESAAVLEAKTFGGQAIRGEDIISIVP